jgi:hypothetical protein
LAILNGDGSSVVETVFVPTLAGLDKGFGEAEIIGGLPVLDIASCFANWLFQKSSFFMLEFDWVPLFQVQDASALGKSDPPVLIRNDPPAR